MWWLSRADCTQRSDPCPPVLGWAQIQTQRRWTQCFMTLSRCFFFFFFIFCKATRTDGRVGPKLILGLNMTSAGPGPFGSSLWPQPVPGAQRGLTADGWKTARAALLRRTCAPRGQRVRRREKSPTCQINAFSQSVTALHLWLTGQAMRRQQSALLCAQRHQRHCSAASRNRRLW